MRRTSLRLLILVMVLRAALTTAQDAAKPNPATQGAGKPAAAQQEPAKPDAAKPDAAKPDTPKQEAATADAAAQDVPKQDATAFRWVDFHNQAEVPVIVWVTRALSTEKWTAIREIGVLYDAALVVTTQRSGPDALPSSDTFQLWSVNLTNKLKTPLLKGVNLRWVDWLNLREGSPRELAALYDDCRECAATTFFTTFHYDYKQHIIAPRWIRGGQAAPVWTGITPAGVDLTQIYGVLAQPDGQQYLATWMHYDYGKQKSAEDFLYRFGVDPFNGVESTEIMTRKQGDDLKPKLCSAQDSPLGMARGQDSFLCRPAQGKAERRPVTTPPPNAQGRSVPPGSHAAPPHK